ncbi:50S ribosomal protein L1 [Deferribacterales bacterium RsTz2092]|nr:50S ribosomal protein L1 [Deferribacterales bacterium]
MAKAGKKFLVAVSAVDGNTLYGATEAIELAKKVAFAKFDETLELAVKLGVDPRHADQMVRGSVVLPHGTGKTVRVLAFARGDKAKDAQAAGADVVGAEDLVAKVEGGWMEFDSVVATPDMMVQVGKLGRVLGPRGLMPNPKVGTVTNDIANIVKQVKSGMVEFRVEKAGIVHVGFGKKSFDVKKLVDNLKTIMDVIVKAKPTSSKGVYVRSVAISTTMGPGIRLDVSKLISEL